MKGIYIKFGLTDFFFSFNKEITLSTKTIKEIQKTLQGESISLSPEVIKYRALKADFSQRVLATGHELIDIKGEGFSFGAFRPAGKVWDHKTIYFDMTKGTKTTFEN